MNKSYEHLGWVVSPYAQKSLAYLKYKGIPFVNRSPNVVELSTRIRLKVNMAVMPIVITPQGQWLQDSSVIIDYFESKYSDNSISPQTPKQKIAAHLLELIGDEWLILSALHYRWTREESAKFVIKEFAKEGAPFLPKPLAHLVGIRVGQMMRKYLKRFGAVGETQKGVERFTEDLLESLDAHFKDHDYLLGNRPCIGDFSIFGSTYAHLYRDPGSNALFNDKPHLEAWVKRMLEPNLEYDSKSRGRFLGNDEVPESLEGILKHFFDEQFLFVKEVIKAVDHYGDTQPNKTVLPRTLGETNFKIGGVAGRRQLHCFAQWKLQRAYDVYVSFVKSDVSDESKKSMQAWLEKINGSGLIHLRYKYRMEKRFFKEVLQR